MCRGDEWMYFEVVQRWNRCKAGMFIVPALFNVILGFVMKELGTVDGTLNYNHQWQWIYYNMPMSDDTTLLSAVFGKVEIATEELEAAYKRWGMKMPGST